MKFLQLAQIRDHRLIHIFVDGGGIGYRKICRHLLHQRSATIGQADRYYANWGLYFGISKNDAAQFSHCVNWKGDFVGFGGWYTGPSDIRVRLEGTNGPPQVTLTQPSAPNWSKVGAMWISDGSRSTASFEVSASKQSWVAVWGMGCGVIEHKHLESARKVLLKNMYQFSPEGHFFARPGRTKINLERPTERVQDDLAPLWLKSCNRCARFLPKEW